MESTVSVVIPTLGREQLPLAVRSVLEQSFTPKEIVLVDNGPSDSTAHSRLRSAGVVDPRIRVVSLPPRSGPGLCRNVGAWTATGTYIAFLDDDDRWAADYLERVVQQLRGSGAELLFATKVFLDSNGRTTKVKRPGAVAIGDWLDVLLEGRNPGVGGQNLVVDREAFFRVGAFPVDLTSGQDRYFTIVALRAGLSLAVADDALVYLHDPVGYRATGRRSNWFNDLKIFVDNWEAMRWRTRVRHARMLVSRTRAVVHRPRARPHGSPANTVWGSRP